MTLAETDVVIHTQCDLCEAKVAVMPGPMNQRKRLLPDPKSGFRQGFVVELAGREFPICGPCVKQVITV